MGQAKMKNPEQGRSEETSKSPNHDAIAQSPSSTLTKEAEKILNKAVEDAVSAALDLVKQRITHEGKPPSPEQGGKEAMSLSTDLIKQEITLAMGAIVFSGTLLKDLYLISKNWLWLSWGAWGLSILLGLFAIGRASIVISEGSYTIKDLLLMWLGIFQQLFLVMGIFLFALFVFFSSSPARGLSTFLFGS
jgi:hypothetical protein